MKWTWVKAALLLLVSLTAQAEEAKLEAGAEEKFSFKKGLFLSGDVGLFTAVGGYRASQVPGVREERTLSSVQPYIGVTMGYDVLDFLALGVKFSQGYVSGAARSPLDVRSPTDFALVFVDAAVIVSTTLFSRVLLSGSVMGGLASMNPPVSPGVDRYGGHLGLGLGLRYDTLWNGMVIGLDFAGHLSFLPKTGLGSMPGIVALSLTPIIKYVF